MVAAQVDKVTGGGVAYRYGGEEFAIIFPGKKSRSCITHLEKVRRAIANYRLALRDTSNRPAGKDAGKAKRGSESQPKTVSVTISIGVAENNKTFSSVEEVIKAADTALYEAKQQGRNCIKLDDIPEPLENG